MWTLLLAIHEIGKGDKYANIIAIMWRRGLHQLFSLQKKHYFTLVRKIVTLSNVNVLDLVSDIPIWYLCFKIWCFNIVFDISKFLNLVMLNWTKWSLEQHDDCPFALLAKMVEHVVTMRKWPKVELPAATLVVCYSPPTLPSL